MEITEETAQAYLNMESNCPACGEKGNAEGGSVEIQSDTAYQEMTCTECEAVWRDDYDLDRINYQDGEDLQQFKGLIPSPTRAHLICWG